MMNCRLKYPIHGHGCDGDQSQNPSIRVQCTSKAGRAHQNGSYKRYPRKYCCMGSVPFCDIEDSDIPTYLLQPNDILFARTGGTVGKSFLVSEVPCKAIYAGYLIQYSL